MAAVPEAQLHGKVQVTQGCRKLREHGYSSCNKQK